MNNCSHRNRRYRRPAGCAAGREAFPACRPVAWREQFLFPLCQSGLAFLTLSLVRSSAGKALMGRGANKVRTRNNLASATLWVEGIRPGYRMVELRQMATDQPIIRLLCHFSMQKADQVFHAGGGVAQLHQPGMPGSPRPSSAGQQQQLQQQQQQRSMRHTQSVPAGLMTPPPKP